MRVTLEEPTTVYAVTDHGAGESIRQRRTALGMTVKALAELAGVDRGRLAAIEDGASARSSTIGAIEAALARLEEEMGGPYDEGESTGLLEFDFTVNEGEFNIHMVAKGPVRDAEELKRQVVDIIREIRRGDQGRDTAGDGS